MVSHHLHCIYYIILESICQYLLRNLLYYCLDVIRLSCPVYATEKRSHLLRIMHGLFVAGSSGIARFATALGVKNADCHTPPAVFVRGGLTLCTTV